MVSFIWSGTLDCDPNPTKVTVDLKIRLVRTEMDIVTRVGDVISL